MLCCLRFSAPHTYNDCNVPMLVWASRLAACRSCGSSLRSTVLAKAWRMLLLVSGRPKTTANFLLTYYCVERVSVFEGLAWL
jgi:hypothetical protein